MSAATLREAAKVLRERATAATPGPWGFTDSEAAASLVNIPDDGMVVLYQGDTPVALCADEFYENDPGEPAPVNDAQYIATMHPGVGIALADWLDTAGADLWAYGPLCCDDGCDECDDDLWSPHIRQALIVARLILGSAS